MVGTLFLSRILSLTLSSFTQVLGDIVESIAGAILIDTKLDLDVVWGVFKPLLSPIVTPENLELPPFRELREWCDKSGYFLGIKCENRGDNIMAILNLQLKDLLLVRQGHGKNKVDAKAHAASLLLRDLEVSLSLCSIILVIRADWFRDSVAQHLFLLAGKRACNSKECQQNKTI